MVLREPTKRQRNGERGNVLYIVAGFMFVMLGIGALAVDLASLYVARTETQRAADAAALAGAKVFVESGCVTTGDCTTQEGNATTRATQVALQNLVEGQAVTVSAAPTFVETPNNPQITVQIQSPNLHVYFAGAIGVVTGPNVIANATAEAYNPSGAGGGSPTFCTGCVRPWLIANCDQTLAAPANGNCPVGQAYLLNPGTNYGVANAGCTTGGGVVGEQLDMKLSTVNPPLTATTGTVLYGAVDVDNGSGNLADYQTGITTCFTGQTTCGVSNFSVLPVNAATQAATTTGVENLMHVTAVGLGLGQDTVDTTVCPPQIHAGGLNPLVTNGVVNVNDVISTSDSIVTAYIFDPVAPLAVNTFPVAPPTAQNVSIVGYAQIFVTQVDPAHPGEIWGVILGVAGCGNNTGGACGSSAILGSTLLPVRLITPAN